MKNSMFNKEKKINKSKIVKLIVLVVIILFAFIITIVYKKNENCREILDKYVFRKDIKEDNLPYIKIDSSKVVGMYAYNRYISILQGNKLEIYNKYGKLEESIEMEISNPLFESNENYLAVSEKNGQKLYFINDKTMVWQKDIEGEISNINVNKNGYVSVTILGTSYKTVIKVFDPSGNELFTYYLASTNIIDTDISNDNKYLAIAEANFSGIVVQSMIKIISIEEAKNNTGDSIKYTYIADSGDLIINIKYQNKNNLICMYDQHIDIIINNENVELINFKEGDTLFADINFSSKVIKIVKNSTGIFNSETEMEIIDCNTKHVTKYQIQNVPKSIVVQDNKIVVNLGTSALFIKDTGWLEKEYESSHEIQKILLCREIAGVVSRDKIEIISL